MLYVEIFNFKINLCISWNAKVVLYFCYNLLTLDSKLDYIDKYCYTNLPTKELVHDLLPMNNLSVKIKGKEGEEGRDGRQGNKDLQKGPTFSWEISILSPQNENLSNTNNIVFRRRM